MEQENTPSPITPPIPPASQDPLSPELSVEQQRLQQTNVVMQTASSAFTIVSRALSRIGREIAMMILRR